MGPTNPHLFLCVCQAKNCLYLCMHVCVYPLYHRSTISNKTHSTGRMIFLNQHQTFKNSDLRIQDLVKWDSVHSTGTY